MRQNSEDPSQTFAAFNDLPSHVWVADARGQLIFANDAWVEYSGSHSEDVVRNGLASVIHPEDVENASRVWRACLRDAAPLQIQVRLRSKAGAYHWFSVKADPKTDENGKLLRFIGINTLLYKLSNNDEISISPDLMVELIKSSRHYQIVFDPTRRKIHFLNRPKDSLFGFPMPTEFSEAEELYTFIHKDDREKAMHAITENLHGHATSIVFRVAAPHAPIRTLQERAVPILNTNKEVTAIIIRVTEVTTEVMLKEENEKLIELHTHILNTVTDGVWLAVQETGENIITSAAYNRLCGYPPESKVTFQMWYDRIYAEDKPTVDGYLERQKSGEHFDMEYRMRHPNGQVIWILDRTLPTKQFGEQAVVGGVMVDITNLKYEQIRMRYENLNLEKKVRESSEELQQLFDNTPIGHHSLDPQGRFTRVNRTELDWLGYTEEEMLSMNFRDLLAPGQDEVFEQAFNEFVESGRIINFPYLLLRKDGSELPVLINSVSKKDENGKFIISYGSMFDNTDLSNIQKKLMEQEARYHSIFSESPEMIYLRDFETDKVVEANAVTTRTLGYTLEELRDLPIENLIIDYDPRDETRIELEKIGWLEPKLRKYRTKNGRLLDLEVSYSLIRDSEGKPNLVQFVCRDLTARLEAERNLLEQRAFVQQLLDTLNVGVVVTNASAQVEYLNDYLADFLGVSSKKVIDQPIVNILPNDLLNRVSEAVLTPKGTGELSTEATLSRRDGILKQFLILAANRGGNGGLIMTVVDITAEKELEANLIISRDALQKANKELEKAVKLKDQFLANMSHELRTPLTGIIGLTEILLTEQLGALSAQQKELMHNIQESGEHLHELINEILDLSRIEAGKFDLQMRFFPVNDLCLQSVKMVEGMALKKRISIEESKLENRPLIYGDQRRLKQVMVNLLGNALKFTPSNGKVGIKISCQPEKENIRITVWDSGIGISDENIERIFEPFIQLDSNLSRQFAGTGLGLTLSRHIVDMHNGTLTVESSEGKGSSFNIDLPYHPDPAIDRIGVAPNDHTAILSTDHLRTAAFPVSVNADPTSVIKKLKTAGIRVFEPVDLEELEQLRLRKVNMIIFLPSKAVSKMGDIWIQAILSAEKLKNTMIVKIDLQDDPLLVGIPAIDDTTSMERTREIVDGYFRENWKKVEGSFVGSTVNHILVVEDNSINRIVMVEYLRGKGYRITEATNGQEAIQAASRSVPDLILMDIQMPVLNGLDATKIIRQMTEEEVKAIPIIAVTVGHSQEEISAIYQAGCNDILEKPIDLEKLYEIVQKSLSKESK